MRRNLVFWALVLLVSPAARAEVDWYLYPSTCTGGAAQVEIACGDYGRFLVLQTQAPDCPVLAKNVHEPPTAYPFPGQPSVFPIVAKRFRDLTIGEPPPTAPHSGPQAMKAVTTSSQLFRWVDVLDFDDGHGESTTWLAGRVAGDLVETVLSPIDDPALEILGPVGDLHVLAKLCEIAEAVDNNHLPPPATINMSFGRRKRPADLDPESSACTRENAACEIAHVVDHLVGDPPRTFVVAAAGNHGGELFPGSLDEVIAAGMLDPTAFVASGVTEPAWETPGGAEAWLPGSSLCLNGWPAPAGSSYSSAMLAGWLVVPSQYPDVVATLGTGPWRPMWRQNCNGYVLTRGVKATPWCNTRVTQLIGALKTAPVSCGGAAVGPTAVLPPLGRSTPPDPNLPSIDTFGDPTRPTPESDPCVPCTGELQIGPTGTDLSIDLSKSGPLPEGIVFDAVFLRVDGFYYPLSLTLDQLQLMREGGLAHIVIPDGGDVLYPGSSLSLWYQLREVTASGCLTSSACFWSSTPLLVGDLK